jgi:hypothetical protein
MHVSGKVTEPLLYDAPAGLVFLASDRNSLVTAYDVQSSADTLQLHPSTLPFLIPSSLPNKSQRTGMVPLLDTDLLQTVNRRIDLYELSESGGLFLSTVGRHASQQFETFRME